MKSKLDFEVAEKLSMQILIENIKKLITCSIIGSKTRCKLRLTIIAANNNFEQHASMTRPLTVPFINQNNQL